MQSERQDFRMEAQRTTDSPEKRLALIMVRIEATLPHLATNADIVGLKWMLGYLGLVMLSGFGFLVL